MPKEEWGVKRVCPKCAVRFYDLQNDPMTCPSCGATFDAASLVQQKSRMTTPDRDNKAIEPVVTEEAEETVVELEEEDSVDKDLGDDLLEEDDDDTVNLEEIADMPANDDES